MVFYLQYPILIKSRVFTDITIREITYHSTIVIRCTNIMMKMENNNGKVTSVSRTKSGIGYRKEI